MTLRISKTAALSTALLMSLAGCAFVAYLSYAAYVENRSELAQVRQDHLARHTMLADNQNESSRVIFFTIGDQGTGTEPQRLVAEHLEAVLAQRKDVQFGLLLGDNFYTSGISSVEDTLWQTVFEEVYSGPYQSGLPFYALLGNHDVGGNGHAQIEYSLHHEGTNRWRMPAAQYSVSFGHSVSCRELCALVQLVVIDTTQTETSLQQQAEFVRESFAGSHAVWRIVAGHHPIRSYGKYSALETVRNAILPVLQEAHVDLYLSGHEHNLQLIERPGEPVYLVGGNGGQKLYEVDTEGPGLVFSQSKFGFNLLDVDEQRMRISVYTSAQATVHELEISRRADPAGARLSFIAAPAS